MSFSEVAIQYAVPILTGVFWLTFALTTHVVLTYWRERRNLRRQSHQISLTSAHQRHGIELRPPQEFNPHQIDTLRAALLPELSEFVKQSIVQNLATQRDALVALQQQAHQSLVDLEVRLSAIQAPLQERIKAYEDRISELERELVAQNCDMRNLTREMLLLTRQKLAQEVEQAGLTSAADFPTQPK